MKNCVKLFITKNLGSEQFGNIRRAKWIGAFE